MCSISQMWLKVDHTCVVLHLGSKYALYAIYLVLFVHFSFLIALDSLIQKSCITQLNHMYMHAYQLLDWSKCPYMSTNSDSEFKIRKWTEIGKMSIRPRTVRPWTADRPQHQEMDSPSSLADRLRSSGRGPSAAPCADRPRQGRKRDIARRLASCAHSVVLFCSPLAIYSLVSSVRGRWSEVVRGQSDNLWQHSLNMSSSRYLQILWISSNFFNFEIIWVSSLIWNWAVGFKIWLVGLLVLLNINAMQNFQLIWLGIICKTIKLNPCGG